MLRVEGSEHSWKGQEETEVEVADGKMGLELGPHWSFPLPSLVSSFFPLSLRPTLDQKVCSQPNVTLKKHNAV